MTGKLKRKHLIIQKSSIHGYGVFAGEFIKEDEVIEECPVLIFDRAPFELRNYLYGWDGKRYVMPLGYGGLYNHSEEPNVWVECQVARELIVYTAKRDIAPFEEIFSFYGKDWFARRQMPVKKLGWQDKLKRFFRR